MKRFRCICIFLSLLFRISTSTLTSCNDIWDNSTDKFSLIGTNDIYTLNFSSSLLDVRCTFVDIGNGRIYIGALFESFPYIFGWPDAEINCVWGMNCMEKNENDLAYYENHAESEMYRWSSDKIAHYKNLFGEPKLFKTCNNSATVDADHLVVSFSDFFNTVGWSGDKCYAVDSVSIRGYSCDLDTLKMLAFWLDSTHGLHTDSSWTDCCQKCGCPWNNGSVSSEDNFGQYAVTNPSFACTASASSTTDAYIGSIINVNLPTSCNAIWENTINKTSLIGTSNVYTLIINSFIMDVRCSFIDIANGDIFVGALFQSYPFQSSLLPLIRCNWGVDCSESNQYLLNHYENDPNSGIYRWSANKMTYYKDLFSAPKLFMTCNNMIDLDGDHLLLSFYDDFIGDYSGYQCFSVDSISIRGYSCDDTPTSVAIWNGPSKGFHVDSWWTHCCSSSKCGCPWNEGAVRSEDNFGSYAFSNTLFTCIASKTSTTDAYIGSIVSGPTISPTKAPTSYPTIFPASSLLLRGYNLFKNELSGNTVLNQHYLKENIKLWDTSGKLCEYSSLEFANSYSTYSSYAESNSKSIELGFNAKTFAAGGSLSTTRTEMREEATQKQSEIYTIDLKCIVGTAFIVGYDDIYWDQDFIEWFNTLPTNYQSGDDITDYEAFWKQFGTHILTTAKYGGSITGAIISDSCSIYNSFTTTDEYKVCLNGAYKGVTAEGCYGESESNTEASLITSSISKTKMIVKGGDTEQFTNIFDSFKDKSADFQDWINGLYIEPDVVGGVAHEIHEVILQTIDTVSVNGANHNLYSGLDNTPTDDKFILISNALKAAYEDYALQLSNKDTIFDEDECDISCINGIVAETSCNCIECEKESCCLAADVDKTIRTQKSQHIHLIILLCLFVVL